MTPERFKDSYQEEASGSFSEDKLLKHRILLGDLWAERHWKEKAPHSITLASVSGTQLGLERAPKHVQLVLPSTSQVVWLRLSSYLVANNKCFPTSTGAFLFFLCNMLRLRVRPSFN